MRPALFLAGAMALAGVAACTGGTAEVVPDQLAPLPFDPTAYLDHVPQGEEQMTVHCMGELGDRVSKAFCASPRPTITGLADVVALFGLDGPDVHRALLANSASLVARSVSAINPRAIVFREVTDPGTTTPGLIALTFTRGDPFVELATIDVDPATQQPTLAFYLVHFQKPCHATHTCTNADLLTPAAETGWSSATLYEDDELTNTALDCTQCHQQSADPEAPRFLRMQERTAPFTHWMTTATDGGRALLADFHAAHDGEAAYGPIRLADADASDPAALRDLLDRFGYAPGPDVFDAGAIEAEVDASAPGQPAENVPAGRSITWDVLHSRALAGQIIPPPYHDAKITDPIRLDLMTGYYKQLEAGTLRRGYLPDIREVVLDEAAGDLGFRFPDTVDGRRLIVAACAQCHNANVDPAITRSRFDATNLDAMPATEKAKAASRVQLPETDPRHMPPLMFRTLSAAQIESAVRELSR
jgi:cytochrome c553